MRDNVKGGALTEVTFFILLSLYKPKHGYAIMQFIEEKTGGRLSLGAGTLYGAIIPFWKRNGSNLMEMMTVVKKSMSSLQRGRKLRKQN